MVAGWVFGYWYTAALAATPYTVAYPAPCRPSGVNQESGEPSYQEETSAPCRCATAGTGPAYGVRAPIWPSGSAQWIVWSTVSSGCTFEPCADHGRLLT